MLNCSWWIMRSVMRQTFYIVNPSILSHYIFHRSWANWQAGWRRFVPETTKFWSAVLFRYKITNNYGNPASIIDENCCRIAPEYVVFNERHDEGDLNTYIRILSSRMCVIYFGISDFRIRNICDIVPVLSLIHIWRCRRSTLCRSRWSPYH